MKLLLPVQHTMGNLYFTELVYIVYTEGDISGLIYEGAHFVYISPIFTCQVKIVVWNYLIVALVQRASFMHM